jgi:hypothetical protein
VLVSHERLDAILATGAARLSLGACADWWNRRIARLRRRGHPSASQAEFRALSVERRHRPPSRPRLPSRARERPADVDGDDNEVRFVCVGRLARKAPAAIEISAPSRGLAARLGWSARGRAVH